MSNNCIRLLVTALLGTIVFSSPTNSNAQSRLMELSQRKRTPKVATSELEKAPKNADKKLPLESQDKGTTTIGDAGISTALKEQIENINDPNLYVLGPNDQIEVSFFEEKELNATKTIDEAGNIRLDLIGSIKVGGLPIIEAQKLILDTYKADYLQDPRVTLSVIQRAKKRFVILGQVRSPGYYEVPRSIRLNVFQAMALAGGYTRLAGRIIIKRTTSRGEVTQKFRLKRLEKKPHNEIPIVAEDDTIIVGETYF